MVIEGVNKVSRFTACCLAAKFARATWPMTRRVKIVQTGKGKFQDVVTHAAGPNPGEHVRNCTVIAVRELAK
jgi:hypothetical protein